MKDREKTPEELARQVARLQRKSRMAQTTNEHHRRDRRALAESEEKYRTVLEASMDAVFLETLEGKVLDCNGRACEMYGYPREELIGLSVKDLVPEKVAEHLPGYIEEELEKGGIDVEAEGRRRNGEIFPTEVRTRLVNIGGKKMAAIFVRDISGQKAAENEKRRLEERVRQTEKLESLGIMAAGAAHDFGNIVTAIMCDAGLMKLRFKNDPRTMKDIGNIEASCRRAGELCERMVAFSGDGRVNMEDVDVGRVVEETAGMMASQVPENVEVKFSLDKAMPMVRADETMVRQVVMNLIKNAVEAMEERKGKITLSASEVKCKREFLDETVLDGGLPEGRYVCMEVKDSGRGMDQDELARMFDPFFTKKTKGKGLGLALVLGVVKNHSGTIKVSSKPGKGTTFSVYLPSGGAAQNPQ